MRSVKRENLFDEPGSPGEELFCRSGALDNFSNLFAALNFWYFSFKRKVRRRIVNAVLQLRGTPSKVEAGPSRAGQAESCPYLEMLD